MAQYIKYKTKSGQERWKYRAYWGINPKTGKPIQPEKQGFKTKKDAKLHCERTLHELDKTQGQKKQNKITFNELYKEYFEFYKHTGVTTGTIKKLELEINKHILPVIGEFYIDKITITDCQKMLDSIRKNRKDFRKIIGYVRNIFAYAENNGYIESNIINKLTIKNDKTVYTQKRVARKDNVYTPEQLMSFLEFAEYHMPFYQYAYFRLLAFSGLRRGEALGLKISDLNIETKSITINRNIIEDFHGSKISNYTKTENAETSNDNIIYLDDMTFNILLKQAGLYKGVININIKDKFLFTPTRIYKNNYYHHNAPNDWISKFWDNFGSELNELGLHYISVHGFRHSHATLLYALNINPKDAQHRLRHANLKTTMDIYTHISESQKQSTASILNEFEANKWKSK